LDYVNTKFSYTNYNFNDAMQLNISLTKEVIIREGGTVSDGKYTFDKDIVYNPVKFEQWPDGVFVYLNLGMNGNTVSFKELTPYSKNEKVLGYTLDMGDGYVFNNAVPAKYTYAKSGTYIITVTVTGDKGTQFEMKKVVNASLAEAAVLDTMIICNVLSPYGGGSRDIGIICDGVVPGVGTSNDKLQYDTYILGDPHGNPGARDAYIGYVYLQKKTVSQIVFTEGGHFGNGGWFMGGTLTIEVLNNGKWEKVEFTSSPEYPTSGNETGKFGKSYETFTFTLDKPVSCEGVRLYGMGGGGAAFISVSELVVK